MNTVQTVFEKYLRKGDGESYPLHWLSSTGVFTTNNIVNCLRCSKSVNMSSSLPIKIDVFELEDYLISKFVCSCGYEYTIISDKKDNIQMYIPANFRHELKRQLRVFGYGFVANKIIKDISVNKKALFPVEAALVTLCSQGGSLEWIEGALVKALQTIFPGLKDKNSSLLTFESFIQSFKNEIQ